MCMCCVQLQWAFGQGAAELFIKFSDKVAVTVGAATLQAVVLLAFNQYPRLTVAYVWGLPCGGVGGPSVMIIQ
jgi:hypothetical protein